MNWRAKGFFAAHRLMGSEVKRYLQEFIDLNDGPAEAVEKLQSQRLEALMAHAAQNVRFYQQRVTAKKPQLSDFPIVTKASLVSQFEDFMDPTMREKYKTKPKGYDWAEVKSGGTTGVPVRVIHDKEFRDRGRASRLFSQYLCGFPLGTPYFWLWGSMEEINHRSASFSKRMLHVFLNTRPMNAFRLTRGRISEYINEINASKVDHMMAYVDAAAELCRVARQSNKPVRQLKSIMACAGTVTEDVRAQIVPFLAGRLHNKYGSRECSDMACENYRKELCIFTHHTLLEVVDDQGKPAATGKTGRILVTLLGNHSFPLIRYEIGDMGALRDPAARGSGPWPQLEKLEGRISDFITDTQGNYVSPVFVRHLIGVMHNPGFIKRYQLRQLTKEQYELFLQLDTDTSEDSYKGILASMEKDLLEVIGRGAKLTFKRVEEIEESGSGKFVYIKNMHH